MIDYAILPTVNATLNSIAAILICCGFLAVKTGRLKLHKGLMLAAVTTSALFLVSYVTYHFGNLHTVFQGEGAVRAIYYAMLISHIFLAVAVVPLVLLTVYRALRGELERHRRIARWTLPIWLYVSVTGVVIYFMLYHWFPSA